MGETIDIETDAEAADVLATNFDSRELRGLASNAGVSRERGDTMRQTAERVVAQDPALAARVIENDHVVDMSASAFREAREVGEGAISLDEAVKRAPSRKMEERLNRIRLAVDGLPSYQAEVDWDYGGSAEDGQGYRERAGWNAGLTAVVVKKRDDWDGSGLAAYRAHAVLKPTGGAMALRVSSLGGDRDLAEKYDQKPASAWRRFVERVERFYDPELS
jgi:hypothetical protein